MARSRQAGVMRLREQNARSKRAAGNIIAKRTKNPHAKANPIIGWQVASGNEVSAEVHRWGMAVPKDAPYCGGKKTADLSTPLRSGRDDNSVVWSILGFPSHWKHITHTIQQICHLDRSAAEWRDLRFSFQGSGIKAILSKQFSDHFRRTCERGVQGRDVFAAGLRHVGPATAGAADFLRQRPDDFPGRETAGQIPRNSRDQGDFPIFLRRPQYHYPRAELVTEIVDQGA